MLHLKVRHLLHKRHLCKPHKVHNSLLLRLLLLRLTTIKRQHRKRLLLHPTCHHRLVMVGSVLLTQMTFHSDDYDTAP